MNSKEKIDFFKKLFEKSWVTQGGSATPLYLTVIATSGHQMKKNLGFSYLPFLTYYKKDYGEGNYRKSDFPRLWKIVKNRIQKNPNYLKEIRKEYNFIFNKYSTWFSKIRTVDFTKLNDQELLDIFKESRHSLTDSINLAHVIEVISVGLEEDLSLYLKNKYSDFEAKKKLAEIQNYYKPSFVNREDKDLSRLRSLTGERLKKGLEKHLGKYYWIMANYAGAEEVTADFFYKRLKHTKDIKKQKNSVLKLAGDLEYKKFVEQIIEVADWQDHRKINIFKAIYHTQKIVNEINKRTGILPGDIHYLSIFELANLKNLDEIKKMKQIFKERREGCITWVSSNKEIIVSGKEFKILEKFYQSMKDKEVEGQTPLTFRGNTANKGKVTGDVCICKSVKDLSKVREGDIIVASMTRPEFMIALKKAKGIITDEGGLTCHASIVSRELDIPCIIGTKVATKVLKDGDLVELNANHGVVTILKSK